MTEEKKARSSRLTWDETFMSLALLVSQRTACKFHTAGVVMVDKNKRIVSMGYNGPTEGDVHCVEVGCAKVDGDPVTKKLKRCRGAHAEINALMNAQDTKRLQGATVYTSLFPCYDCVKALNNAGIKEIVYFQDYARIKTGGEQKEEENEAKELLEMRDIKFRQYTPKIAAELQKLCC